MRLRRAEGVIRCDGDARISQILIQLRKQNHGEKYPARGSLKAKRSLNHHTRTQVNQLGACPPACWIMTRGANPRGKARQRLAFKPRMQTHPGSALQRNPCAACCRKTGKNRRRPRLPSDCTDGCGQWTQTVNCY